MPNKPHETTLIVDRSDVTLTEVRASDGRVWYVLRVYDGLEWDSVTIGEETYQKMLADLTAND